MKLFKKVVDERQELEMLRIEHVVLWIVYGGLIISIIVQAVFLRVPIEQFAAELVILLVCSVGILIGCVRKGQWDFYMQPTIKTYLLTSAIGAGVFGLIFAAAMYFGLDYYRDNPRDLPIVTAFLIVFTFITIFSVSAFVGMLVKRKRAELEKAYGDEEEE